MSPIFQRNQNPPVLHRNEYSTDLVGKKALGFLEDAVKNPDTPFFLAITPIAPHANFEVHVTGNISDIVVSGNLSASDPPIGIITSPPISAPRHSNLFPNAIVPRTPNFNPEKPSSVDWIAETERLSAGNVTFNDLWYRQRLRSLQAVDEIVDQGIAKLEAHGILDNTYIIYTSDNGYHIGQHRLQPGKGCGIEEDISVPLVMRGPGVPQGEVVNRATSHTDLAPTLFEIMGIPLRSDFDGVPIPTTHQSIIKLKGSGKAKEHVQIEFWSTGNPGEYNDNEPTNVNNTYKGLRIVAEEYGFYYSVWCSGSHELYDMKVSPSYTHCLGTTRLIHM
jgi:arylsulfatase A-like enzyme